MSPHSPNVNGRVAGAGSGPQAATAPVRAAITTGTAAITNRALSIGAASLSAGESVAQEEVPVLLAQRSQGQGGSRGERRARQDPFGFARHQVGGQREAQLVEDSGAGQRPV